jgi:PIN domain nuclease of toxin-antitoxin system
MSPVNVAEVVKHLLTCGASENEISNLIDKSLEKIITFDRKQAFIEANLYNHIKQFSLSLADRACFALAQDTSFPLYTADKIWSKLNIDGILVNLIC